MPEQITHRLMLVATLVGLMPACACATDISENSMQPLAAMADGPAKSVRSFVLDHPAEAKGLSDEELVWQATAHDKALLDPFAGWVVKGRAVTLADGVQAEVLVCTPDRKRALIEDASCTAKPDDMGLWCDPNAPCAFRLDLAVVCGEKGR